MRTMVLWVIMGVGIVLAIISRLRRSMRDEDDRLRMRQHVRSNYYDERQL